MMFRDKVSILFLLDKSGDWRNHQASGRTRQLDCPDLQQDGDCALKRVDGTTSRLYDRLLTLTQKNPQVIRVLYDMILIRLNIQTAAVHVNRVSETFGSNQT